MLTTDSNENNPKSGKKQIQPSGLRQRLLSNESINFFWDKNEKLQHHKTCAFARQISDEALQYSESFNVKMEQCPVCAQKSYIMSFAKDPGNFQRYVPLLKQMGIKYNMLQRIYVQYGMTTQWTSDGIIFIYHDEWWKLKPGTAGKGSIRLFHNNYSLADGQKIRVPGCYHEQFRKKNFGNIEPVLKEILQYDVGLHGRNYSSKQPKEKPLVIKPSARTSVFGRLYIRLGKKCGWV